MTTSRAAQEKPRRRKPAYSVPDDEVLATGVRFTVAELRGMADDYWRGVTPPPLSYNESVLLHALIRADEGSTAGKPGRRLPGKVVRMNALITKASAFCVSVVRRRRQDLRRTNRP